MPVVNAASCITDEVITRLNRPTEHAVGLPREVYTSADFFELERDRVLANTWFCVGIAADIPNPGDLRPYDFAGVPLLLLRDRTGNVRAFHNVCSHRGVQLVAEPRNTRGNITCPYHAWTYDLDGRLLRRPRFCGEPHCPDDKFDPVALGLKPVRCELWHQLILVNHQLGRRLSRSGVNITPKAHSRWRPHGERQWPRRSIPCAAARTLRCSG